MDGRLSRRALLSAAAAGGLALVLPVRLRPGGLGLPAAAAEKAKKGFKARLRIPPVLSDPQIRIEMRQARIGILPGPKTKMWTYGGSFPGPTIRRPSGQPTEVTFVHRLPPKAGELSVHLHGGHNRSAEDGQPGGLTARQPRALYCRISDRLAPADSGNDLLIEPGGERTYRYDLIEDGGPERAAFQWYHDHRLERTAQNVWRGLAGMMIIDDELDSSLPLPAGERDIPLMLVDRSFDKHNQLTDPFASGAHAPNDGVFGRLALVNGVDRPYHKVRAARYRVRILNAANFSLFNLELSDGSKLTQIATESGLMPSPIKRRRALISPGERIELILDFRHLAGERVRLRSRRRPQDGGLASHTFDGDLMEFRVGRKATDTSRIPASLRPLPDWVNDASPAPDRKWKLTISKGFTPTWLINGKTFDPSRVAGLPGAGDDRDLGASQPHGGRPRHAHALDRLVHARAQRAFAQALGAVPEGDLPARAGRPHPRRRPLQRLHRQVRDPLPHARPRGPRPDVAVRGRRAGLRAPGRRPRSEQVAQELGLVPLDVDEEGVRDVPVGGVLGRVGRG